MFVRRPSKAQLTLWSKLRMAKYRRQEGLFLAEGVKVVGELLQSDWKPLAFMILEGQEHRWEAWTGDLRSAPAPLYLLKRGEWKALSQDREPEGLMALAAAPAFPDVQALREGTPPGHLVAAYRISNPNNLGALLRTAHWFGLRNIALGEGSVDPLHPKVVRASMGSLFHSCLWGSDDLEATLHGLRPYYTIIAADAAFGTPPRSLDGPALLVLGNETHGLPPAVRAIAHECWRIPGSGNAESLSLPQAAAIMMYELTRKGTTP
jgi:TrmH family RNA methyltransferase